MSLPAGRGGRVSLAKAPEGFIPTRVITSSHISTVTLGRDGGGNEVVLKTPSISVTRGRRFEREVTTMRAHPGYHVMPVLDYGHDFSWFTMPVATRSLWQVEPRLRGWDLALTITQAVAEALRGLHDAGQVHRDLKPQNILWLETAEGSRWVVSDFGEVRNPAGLTTNQLTRPDAAVGTDSWMAPEQHGYAHAATPAADVYSLGAVVAWILTGSVPSPTDVPLPDNPPIRGVLARATAQRPSDRYGNVNLFAEALERATEPITHDLASAVAARAFGDLNTLLLDPELEMWEIATELPKLPSAELRRWGRQDPAAFARSARRVFSSLRSSDLFGSRTDALLLQGVDVLRALFREGLPHDAERVATDLFAAIAERDQWDPADEVVRLLAAATDRQGDLLESSMIASDSRGYFRPFAARRTRRDTDSPAIRRLRR